MRQGQFEKVTCWRSRSPRANFRPSGLRWVLLFVLLSSLAVPAQQVGTGLPLYGSFNNGDFDVVNRHNLNTFFAIPVVSSPGRGMDLNFAITYNSLVWANSGSAWVANGGWKTDLTMGAVTKTQITEQCDDPSHTSTIHYLNFKFTDSNGTVHPFSIDFYTVPTPCGFPTDPKTGYATDASG